MNYAEVNKQTAASLQRRQQQSIFANGWEASGRLLSSLAIEKDSLQGAEESFLGQSKVLPELLKHIQAKELSLTDMIILAQSAKAIEDGDTKAATFVRDTAGGKPVERKQDLPSTNLYDLTDEQILFLEEHAEVIEDE